MKMIELGSVGSGLEALASDVRQTGEAVILTKDGQPWVQVIAVVGKKPVVPKKPVLGFMKQELAGLDTSSLDRSEPDLTKLS